MPRAPCAVRPASFAGIPGGCRATRSRGHSKRAGSAQILSRKSGSASRAKRGPSCCSAALPPSLTFLRSFAMILILADVAELADALDLGSSGRPCRFNSCHPHHVGTGYARSDFLFKKSPSCPSPSLSACKRAHNATLPAFTKTLALSRSPAALNSAGSCLLPLSSI